ncbi:MAG: 4Fe-4S dicluster domain-containing protein, partial [archaeon]|nr:4Fe-4S dicluster domain-containing protein [archaeon]
MEKKLTKKDLKPIERSTPVFLKVKKFGWLTKLPILKQKFRKLAYPRGFDVQAAQIIPVNLNVGEYENNVIPIKLMDYFIEKAGTIVLVQCPCRVTNNCENHSHDLGCLWMGKGAANLELPDVKLTLRGINTSVKGRSATKEEAREHVSLALKNGLTPALAKLRGDAKLFNVLDYEDEFMNFCFCCSCCCITAGDKYMNDDHKNFIYRMEGVSVTTDPEKCTGCGACFKVCIYAARKMVQGKAVEVQDNCLGCGRCEIICPEKAISMNFDENIKVDDVMDNIIKRYENIVDISG